MKSVNSPLEALKRLKEGNQRFASGLRSIDTFAATAPERRRELAARGQTPFAVVLCCADSRVPAETVFDCGLGDLFVVRVAGNIVAPSLIGSIEFAVANFGTKLVVVMGHSQCGAVKATLDLIAKGDRADSDNIQNIVAEIAPSARRAIAAVPRRDAHLCLDAATRLNVEHSLEQLRYRSNLLNAMAECGVLVLAGAVYDLHHGSVDFVEPRESSQRTERHGLVDRDQSVAVALSN